MKRTKKELEALSLLGRMGGRAKSRRKTMAAAENLKKAREARKQKREGNHETR